MGDGTDLQTFPIPGEHADLRVLLIDGEPWFVAADVARVLGYTHVPAMLRMLKSGEKGVRQMYTPGGEQEVSIISEPGFYRVVMRSNRPEADAFQTWVTADVLPQIRKTGGYGAPRLLDPAEERKALARYVLAAEEAREQAEERADKAQAELEATAAPLEEWYRLVNSSGVFPVAVVAKAFGTGSVRLFAFLRHHRFLIGVAGERFNTPFQHHQDAGRAEIKLGSRADGSGRNLSTYTTMITPKGVEYIGKLIREHGRNDL